RTLFPRLVESDLGLELFYETKANLKYHQVRLLRDGGVRSLQPGIESFSTEVLRLMRKGTTGAQNLQLLRWCAELDIEVLWNILFNFQGESPAAYTRQAALVPLLTHLEPPEGCVPFNLDRFSPLFTRAAQYGLTSVRPYPAYEYVYPLPREELA